MSFLNPKNGTVRFYLSRLLELAEKSIYENKRKDMKKAKYIETFSKNMLPPENERSERI
ncbi:MAG: hypothetical protein IPL63_14870 [Saprospiraceae bacterium]|nr:hypothetical protein [Saprospiraceae bacterium]